MKPHYAQLRRNTIRVVHPLVILRSSLILNISLLYVPEGIKAYDALEGDIHYVEVV
ncbi:hypothetical protein IX318_001272 [Porphyromonas levii]|nr:hypothetical protein [Porphyromonas levii]MBR8715409.1 hypothetical protein [Porphyromonas levii]MBR8727940.1 hypothetical protein [Porphyromonas levii]MBR8732142.1 hypothetical protein [Porphyromonas levii]MBR8736279.1 hypothetical protein [Porphyromonas levii]